MRKRLLIILQVLSLLVFLISCASSAAVENNTNSTAPLTPALVSANNTINSSTQSKLGVMPYEPVLEGFYWYNFFDKSRLHVAGVFGNKTYQPLDGEVRVTFQGNSQSAIESGPFDNVYFNTQVTFDIATADNPAYSSVVIGFNYPSGDFIPSVLWQGWDYSLYQNSSLAVGEIKSIASDNSCLGFHEALEILVKSAESVNSLPNPINDQVGNVIRCLTNEDSSTLKPGQIVNANIGLIVPRGRANSFFYIYNIH